MKRGMLIFPAVLFTLTALMGMTKFLDNQATLNSALGTFIVAALAVLCWRLWLRAGPKTPPPEIFRKRMSKKERRKCKEAQNRPPY